VRLRPTSVLILSILLVLAACLPVLSGIGAGGQAIPGPWARALAVAGDPEGVLWAIWEEPTGPGRDLYYSLRRDGRWQAARVVHHRPATWDRAPSLAVAADGSPWLAWVSAEGAAPGQAHLFASHYHDGAWSEPALLPVGNFSRPRDPFLAAAPDGALWLAWAAFDGLDDEIYASRWDGRAWSPPTRVSADDADPRHYDRQPRLAVAADGTAWLAWTGHQQAAGDDEIFAARWTGGRWTAEQQVSRDDEALDLSPALALDGQDRPWLAWKGRVEQDGQSRLRILVARWDGRAWTPEALASSPLDRDLDESAPALFRDRQGQLRLAWQVSAGGAARWAHARWLDGRWTTGRWAGPRLAGRQGAGDRGTFALDDGDLHAFWLVASGAGPLAGPVTGVHVDDGAPRLDDGTLPPPAGRTPDVDPIANRHLAFGDSITYGGYSDHPYPGQLEGTLDLRVAESEVINAGNPGEATFGGSERIAGEVTAHQPQYVLILEGTNDVTRDKLPADVYDNLRTMIANARDQAGVQGVQILVATIIPRNDYLNPETETMNNLAVIPAAADEGVPLCDQWSAFMANPFWENMFIDHVHPNDVGLQLIADNFYNCLLASFPELNEETTPPEAWIESLPPDLGCDPQSVPVAWNGADNLNWVVDYDLQVQPPGEAWADWLLGTIWTGRSYAFAGGTYGQTLGFRVRGRDWLGNQGDWSQPAYATVTLDTDPPQAFLDWLPPYHLAGVPLRWGGSDACAQVVAYHLQYRAGPAGTWTDWLPSTPLTTATFLPTAPQYGQTYTFRASARDQAGNWSPWSGEEQTVLAQYGLAGRVYDVRGRPVAAPQVTVDPSPLHLASVAGGGFLAYLAEGGTYDLSVARPDLYGPLPAKRDLPVTGDVADLAFVLPPHDDAVADGGFEAGDLAAWQPGGSPPPALTATAHTGLAALQMGSSDLDAAGFQAALSQTVTPGPALSDPTLSFMVRLAQPGPAGALEVSLANGGAFSPPLTLVLSVESEAWTHVWYNLSGLTGDLSGLSGNLSGLSGDAVPFTLTFTLSGSATVLLDEVSLGSALPGGHLIYLPLTFRP
jgi:lysophospholipase L1-like esterase